jgi:uncharacterized membrane protein
VTTYHWLLALHVTGAVLLLGGSAAAGVLYLLALRARRPGEIARLLGLVRLTVPVVLAGSLVTLVLGLWLVHHLGYGYGEFWIWAAIVLWLIGNYLCERGGRTQRRARKLAERLAADGDAESPELLALLRDAKANAMSWAAGLAFVAALVLMLWKPGR